MESRAAVEAAAWGVGVPMQSKRTAGIMSQHATRADSVFERVAASLDRRTTELVEGADGVAYEVQTISKEVSYTATTSQRKSI